MTESTEPSLGVVPEEASVNVAGESTEPLAGHRDARVIKQPNAGLRDDGDGAGVVGRARGDGVGTGVGRGALGDGVGGISATGRSIGEGQLVGGGARGEGVAGTPERILDAALVSFGSG